ncbi:uncharacterized protein G2W53_006374 [Senna tora]|uniref:Uncharacterized protein n=1 Tax=Senna tora TaxID=362788 RepID=A0A834X3W3_9FABA|nr:uncharacterized protein G2W53_006374 [Senna tora]
MFEKLAPSLRSQREAVEEVGQRGNQQNCNLG